MTICALLTGRGNNTLQDKNIREVNGHPLLAYPAMAAKEARGVEHLFVSSDDPKILKAAENYGYQPILRPKFLAAPDSKHIDAIFHGVEYMQKQLKRPIEILVVLLANSGTIKTEWIDQGIQFLIDNPEVSSVVPVYKEQDHHPYRAKRVGQDGFLKTYFDFGQEEISTNRQDLPDNYFLCHNFWILNMKQSLFREGGQKPWVFLGEKIYPIIVEESFDVHDLDDIQRTEVWLKENGISYPKV